MESYWQKTELPHFPALTGDLRTDVLIIGGGIAGLLTAWQLKKEGVDCVLVESGKVCSGNTGRTTAKITAQHGIIYSKIAKYYGPEAAALYYQANTQALEAYAELSGQWDFDFSRQTNYVYSLSDRRVLDEELEVLQSIGADAFLREELPLPIRTVGAVGIANQAQMDPLKFLRPILTELNIREDTHVREMNRKTVLTDHGTITAEKIVVATHYPIWNRHGSYFMKLYQQRSYVLGLEGAEPVDGMYVDGSSSGFSFRNAGPLLLLGGGGNRTGTPCGNWESLYAFSAAHYPQSRIRYTWAAQDCMSLDGIPYIGHYSRWLSNVFVASGFSKWGMTSSMAASMLLRDLILGRQNPYAGLFDPSRSIFHRQLYRNAGHAAAGLVRPSTRICTHMSCGLKWNEAEHSWDCPCHGSRFSETGELLDGPARKDLPAE